MPRLDDVLRRRLIDRFGSKIDLESDVGVVSDIIAEVTRDIGVIVAVDKYDKTYNEGYNKDDYSKSSYTKYDKTNLGDSYQEVINVLRPELDRLLIERIRSGIGREHSG